MRKMFSKNQIEEMINSGITPEAIVNKLVNQDINVAGLTVHGIANTGNFGNIGDGVFSGNVYIQSDTEDNGNLEVEGAITAKTLHQSQPNYLFTFNVEITDDTNFTPSIPSPYCRIEEVNGEIHLILVAGFINNDSANHSTTLKATKISNIPAEISEKLYTTRGHSLAETSGIGEVVRMSPMCMKGNSTKVEAITIYKSAQNEITISETSSMTAVPTQELVFSLEVNFSIL